MGLYCVRGGLFEVFTIEPVPEEDIKMLLHLASVCLVKVKLFLRVCLFTLLKVNRIDVINTNQTQEEHAYIPGIAPEFLNDRVRVMQQHPLIDTDTVLRLFILVNKAHVFQDFVEHNVVNLVIYGQVDG